MDAVPPQRKWKTQADNVLRILVEVLAAQKNGVPADRTLARIHRENRCYGSRDRQFFYLAVFAWFRWFGWTRHMDCDNRLRLLAALVTEAPAPFPPAGDVLAAECGYTGDLRAICSLPTPEDRFHAFSGVHVNNTMLVPDWALPALADGANDRFLPSLKKRSPLWVRVAAGHQTEVTAEWRKAGLEFQCHPRVPTAFRFPNDRILFDSFETWKKGLFEIQDFSSQCIGLAADARPGERWFDPCAGGGGKTMQIADMLQGKGSVSVYDIRDFKLDVLQKRAARTPYGKLIRRESSFNVNKSFDGILLDAPCSSSGRWRRDPDSRWAIAEDPVSEIVKIQYDLLCKASKMVRPGGKLIYGTCSVFSAENVEIATRFLTEHPDFETIPVLSPHSGKNIECGMLQTFPADSDCDGAFVAAFRRKG